MRFVRVLGRGKRVFKDSVRLIARFYSRSEYDKGQSTLISGAPQRQAVGTFDVCLARPKVCPTDIVRPHAAQLMIDTSILQNMA